ncbi:hypothetical protein AALO_G00032270 [Alosa alosa]|uniref:Uncharacterized protein n=1 Tax=Alosa alosa TaxID=278164 RepID=A0AAV6HC64_9TELE|nr:hypothetical protein AALO_G00032270 [Alosa alosa]
MSLDDIVRNPYQKEEDQHGSLCIVLFLSGSNPLDTSDSGFNDRPRGVNQLSLSHDLAGHCVISLETSGLLCADEDELDADEDSRPAALGCELDTVFLIPDKDDLGATLGDLY